MIRQREHVGYILKSGRDLLALIDEVLELSRIEAGRLDLSQEPVSLVEAIKEVVAPVRPIASEHGVILDAEFDGLVDDGHVQADRQRLKQVLLNLLSNGIKYNHDGGRVEISFAQTGTGRIRTLVHDSGVGIEPEQLTAVFEPFERLGAELTEVEGTGLGLALSKRLLEAMAGSIAVESERGAGTTFAVELDTAQPPDTDQRAPTMARKPSLIRGRVGSQQILYIEDNLANLKLVERIKPLDVQRFLGVIAETLGWR